MFTRHFDSNPFIPRQPDIEHRLREYSRLCSHPFPVTTAEIMNSSIDSRVGSQIQAGDGHILQTICYKTRDTIASKFGMLTGFVPDPRRLIPTLRNMVATEEGEESTYNAHSRDM